MSEFFELTGQPLLVLAIVVAALLPILAVFLWTRRRNETAHIAWRIAAVAGRLGIVLLAQVAAMSAIFLYVNDDYGFYASWSDLLGIQSRAPQTISVTNLNPGQGHLEVLPVKNSEGVDDDVLVWLPPGYNEMGDKKLPVVMFLPGQPSTASRTFNHFDFGTFATQEISSGKVKPFIGVFPPIMVSPPRDTECVDVPGGPQAETWLTTTVPQAVEAEYRAEPPGEHWAVLGFSTGALCAAKLVLRYPHEFKAGVAFAGEYEPYLDDTTGDLFQGDQQLRNENSSRWLYAKYGMRGSYLLMISSKQDLWAWRDTERMSSATTGDPNVALVTVPRGGHNFATYTAYVPTVLEWLAAHKVLG